jgi:hypothetical protein
MRSVNNLLFLGPRAEGEGLYINKTGLLEPFSE